MHCKRTLIDLRNEVIIINVACNTVPAKNPGTNCSTSSDSSLIAQSSSDGRDVCSSVPQSDNPFSVVSGQFSGHSY